MRAILLPLDPLDSHTTYHLSRDGSAWMLAPVVIDSRDAQGGLHVSEVGEPVAHAVEVELSAAPNLVAGMSTVITVLT